LPSRKISKTEKTKEALFEYSAQKLLVLGELEPELPQRPQDQKFFWLLFFQKK
jgi:hypothetical protein